MIALGTSKSSKSLSSRGVSSLPFYKLRKGQMVHERERKRRKRKTERKGALELRHPSPSVVGLAGLIDEDGDAPRRDVDGDGDRSMS
jgi:hypothetical protein